MCSMPLWVCVILLLVGRSFAFVPRSRPRGLVPAASWMLRKSSSKSDTTAASVVPVGSSKALWAQGEAAAAQVPAMASPSLSKQLVSLTRLVNRVSWLSWWTQITLSIISGVILTFAGTVRAAEPGLQNLWASGFAFSAMGVVLALMNALSTWNITRVCRRIKRGRINGDNVLRAWRKYFRLSVTLSFVGLLLTLFGAEQIVGNLASKVLSSQGLQVVLGGMSPQNSLQAVDIFLVQANTNTVIAHFVPLLSYVWLGDQLKTADATATADSGTGSGSGAK